MPLTECAELGRLLGRLHAELGSVLPPIQQKLAACELPVWATLRSRGWCRYR